MTREDEWVKKHEKRSEMVGMPFSKARYILRKTIMFNLVKECGRDICFRCKEKIEDIDNFSIDHKEIWMKSDDPIKSFFDLNNIAFSHYLCNCKHNGSGDVMNNKHGYKGIYHVGHKHKRKKYYSACLYIDRNNPKRLGYFETPKEAAIAYDKAAIEYLGDKAVTNKSLGLL